MRRVLTMLTLPVFLVALVSVDAAAQGQGGRNARAQLDGFEEVPALSTAGRGEFRGRLSVDRQEMEYRLIYHDLVGEVAQAHLHLGQRSVNGGIAIFLCTNLGNDPTGNAPPCPPPGEPVSGTVSAADVIGPAAQGLLPGDWEAFRDALRAGVTYANVHTDLFPAGEIRGQVLMDRRRADGAR